MECGYIQIIQILVAVLTDNKELLEENPFFLFMINCRSERRKNLAIPLIIKVEHQRKSIETNRFSYAFWLADCGGTFI